MRYSLRKLSNDKVITTACNFWRQIAWSFQVMSRNILFLGNKIFEIPPFFQTRPGDLGKKVHACSVRFSALNPWPQIRHQSELSERDWENALRGKGKGEMDGIRVNSFSSVNVGRKSDTRKDRITVFKGLFSCQFLKVGGLFQWCRLDGTIHLGNIRSCSMSSAIGNVLVFKRAEYNGWMWQNERSAKDSNDWPIPLWVIGKTNFRWWKVPNWQAKYLSINNDSSFQDYISGLSERFQLVSTDSNQVLSLF